MLAPDLDRQCVEDEVLPSVRLQMLLQMEIS
jgi:hypothetical protein